MEYKENLSYQLAANNYRKLLIMTETWQGIRAMPGSLVMKAYSGGNKIPFFWCGAPNTLPGFYDKLGQDRSIYCFPGNIGILKPTDENIKALGNYYTAEIIKIQPNGPYLIGGYCQGGLVSHEIACNLQEAGFKVAGLLLFDVDMTQVDTWLTLARQLFFRGEHFFLRQSQFVANPIACLREVFLNKYRRYFVRPFRALVNKYINKQIPINGAQQQDQSICELKKPLYPGHELLVPSGYKLSPFSGKIHLIYIRWGVLGFFQFSFFQRYWKKIALGGYEVSFVEGRSHRMPNWIQVAEISQGIIKKLQV